MIQGSSPPQAGAIAEQAVIAVPPYLPLAPLRLRLMSLVYESMLLLAVLFLSSYLFLSLARDAQSGKSPATIGNDH